MLCKRNYCVIEMSSMNDNDKSTLGVCSYRFQKTLSMFHAKTFLFDHIYLHVSMPAKMSCFVKLTMEYIAAASLNYNIRINIKLSISFFCSWKTFSLVISVHVNASTNIPIWMYDYNPNSLQNNVNAKL